MYQRYRYIMYLMCICMHPLIYPEVKSEQNHATFKV